MTQYSPEMLETFSRIGQKLKAVRETQSMTLSEISLSTKIHHDFLDLIEKGELEKLPNLAFVKGFVRNFLQVLHLEDAELEADLRSLTLDTPEEPTQLKSGTQANVLDVEPSGFPLVKMAFYLVLFAALGGIGFFLFLGTGDEDPATPGKSVEITPAPPAGDGSGQGSEKTSGQKPAEFSGKPSRPVKPGTAPSPAAQVPPPQPRPAPKNLNLTIRGLEKTWVRLTIDKNPPVDVLLEAADTQRWEADQEFRLIVGKSQGVAVFLNGLDFPLTKEPNRLIPEMVLDKLALLKLENCSTQGGC